MRRPGAGLTWAEGVRALRVANGGLYRNAAGQGGVLVGLRAALISTGGDLRPLVALEGIDVPRTGGARLHLAAGGTVKADRVIVDLPLAEGQRLIPAEALRALARKGLEECKEQAYGLLEMTLAPGRRPVGMGTYLVIAAGGDDPDGPAVLLAASDEADDGSCALEALGFFPPGEAAGAREHLLARVRTIIPFLDESLVGEPVCRTGAAPRYTQERLDRGQREERLATGWRTSIFHHAALHVPAQRGLRLGRPRRRPHLRPHRAGLQAPGRREHGTAVSPQPAHRARIEVGAEFLSAAGRRHGPLEETPRLGLVALRQVRPAEVVERRAVGRVDRDGPLQRRDGLGEAAGFDQQIAVVLQGLGVPRVDGQERR